MEKVTTHNLSYIAEKYNVDIMEAEIIVAQIGPDPELTIEGSKECFTLELGYTLEMGGANIQHV
ncbi:MAG: hypothetical protein LIO65_04570 [Odoribacter sp.]|nr:hypothetical protein [Odoribacter sp.]